MRSQVTLCVLVRSRETGWPSSTVTLAQGAGSIMLQFTVDRRELIRDRVWACLCGNAAAGDELFILFFFFCSLSSFFCSPLLSFLYPSFHTCLLHLFNFFSPWFSTSSCINLFLLNLLKPTGHVMHQQFNIQQLYALPTLYFCVLYLSENTQRLVPLTA